jgi:hypothetical protein
MLNEREQTIPLKSDIAPYYKWDDVKKYFCDIIAKAPKE